ncbi:hypothetical protein JCM11251_006760 [Rhodosporidiobolus azoricus]
MGGLSLNDNSPYSQRGGGGTQIGGGSGGPPPAPPSYGQALRSSVDGAVELDPSPGGAGGGRPVAAGGRSNGRTSGGGPQRRSSVEDRLAPLARYDTVILVDDSPSMTEYWQETKDALMGCVNACAKYDKDGIDLFFMNNEDCKLHNVTSPEVVASAFDEIQPFGSTPTGVIMDEILRTYVEEVEDAKTTKTRMKPMLLLVLTDGRADDPDMVKDIIIEFAQRLDEIRAPPYQLGIQFIQLGEDPDAQAFLQELDDELKPQLGVRDMVDTTPYQGSITPEFILKAALGAVVKSIDG